MNIDTTVLWWGIADRMSGFLVGSFVAGDAYKTPLLFKTRRQARAERSCNFNYGRYLVVRVRLIVQIP